MASIITYWKKKGNGLKRLVMGYRLWAIGKSRDKQMEKEIKPIRCP